MTRPLRSELLKLRTVPLGWAPPLLAAGSAAVAAAATVQAAGTGPNPPLVAADLPRLATLAAPFATTVALVAGVLFATAEWRYGGIVDTFLRTPRRVAVVGAKLVVTALAGLATGLAGAVAAGGTAYVGMVVDGLAPDPVAAAVGNAVLAGGLAGAGYAALGCALGLLLRQQAAALVVALLWRTGAESALAVVLRLRDVADWLPAAAGATLATAGHGPTRHSMLVAGTVFAAYVGALAAAAAVRTVRSDAG